MTEDELTRIAQDGCAKTDVLTLIAEVRLQRHRADANQRRVEALERQALADAEAARGLRELVDAATAFEFGHVQIMHFSEGWQMWDLRKEYPEDGIIVTQTEAVTRAKDLAAKGKGET